jgi:hypothetical protein
LLHHIKIDFIMNNLLKWGLGLAALGVTVYVAGRAWKKSQENKKDGSAGFAGAAGPSGRAARFQAIAKAGGFRNADGFADAAGPSSRAARFQAIAKAGGFRN